MVFSAPGNIYSPMLCRQCSLPRVMMPHFGSRHGHQDRDSRQVVLVCRLLLLSPLPRHSMAGIRFNYRISLSKHGIPQPRQHIVDINGRVSLCNPICLSPFISHRLLRGNWRRRHGTKSIFARARLLQRAAREVAKWPELCEQAEACGQFN